MECGESSGLHMFNNVEIELRNSDNQIIKITEESSGLHMFNNVEIELRNSDNQIIKITEHFLQCTLSVVALVRKGI